MVPECVAHLEDIELLGEAHPVAHIEPRRQKFAEHERSLVGEIRLQADILDANARAELLRQERTALGEGLVPGAGGLLVLHRLQPPASQDQRHDLRLRQGRVREEAHSRLPQCAADVDAGGDVREFLDGTQVDAGILDGTAREYESAMLNVELACIRAVLAFLDRQLAGRASDFVVTAAHRDAACQPASQSGSVDRHLVAQGQRDGAHDLEARGRILPLCAHDDLVGRGEDRTLEIRRYDLRVGDFDRAGDLDLAALDVEIEAGRGVDLRLGDVHDAQSRALQLEVSVGQRVAPLEMAAGARGPLADMSRALEIQAVVRQARPESHLPQRQVDLIEIDLAVGDREGAVHERLSEAALELEVRIQTPRGPVDFRHVQGDEAEIARMGVQLALDGHVRPFVGRALRSEGALDRTDLAGVEADFGGDGGGCGVEADET